MMLFAGLALAESNDNSAEKPMHAGHGKMRAAMQECMKSGKPMSDCRNEMMKAHRGMRGKEDCPMKGHMHDSDNVQKEG
jgi:hypothetical protein